MNPEILLETLKRLLRLPLTWYAILLFGFAIFYGLKAISRFVRYIKARRVLEPWMAADRRDESLRFAIRMFVFFALGTLVGWVSFEIEQSFQPVRRVTQAGELTVSLIGKTRYHARYLPADSRFQPVNFRGTGYRLALVGAFLSCPDLTRYVLFPSGHQFIGFHLEKNSMDFTPQGTLFELLFNRTTPGFKLAHYISKVIPGCKTLIRASPPIQKSGRYIVFATPKGYILESLDRQR